MTIPAEGRPAWMLTNPPPRRLRRAGTHVVANNSEQGWRKLCNGVILFPEGTLGPLTVTARSFVASPRERWSSRGTSRAAKVGMVSRSSSPAEGTRRVPGALRRRTESSPDQLGGSCGERFDEMHACPAEDRDTLWTEDSPSMSWSAASSKSGSIEMTTVAKYRGSPILQRVVAAFG
jgi:hypothetical protein